MKPELFFQPVHPTTHSGLLVEPFLLLNNSDGCFRVTLNKIAYCTSYNSSTQFHLANKTSHVVAESLSYYQKLLKAYGFVRVHDSTLMNIAYFCHCCKGDKANEILLTTGDTLKISRPKKKAVMHALLQLSVEGQAQTKTKQDKPENKQVKGKNKQDSHKTKPALKNETLFGLIRP